MKVEKRSDATDVSCAKSDRASIRLVTALADWPYLSAILFLTSLLIHPSKSASYRSTAHCNCLTFSIDIISLRRLSFAYFLFMLIHWVSSLFFIFIFILLLLIISFSLLSNFSFIRLFFYFHYYFSFLFIFYSLSVLIGFGNKKCDRSPQ